MSVWDGPDDRPGSHDSLYVLYYLVRVAEEEDLLDEVRRERAGNEWDSDPSREGEPQHQEVAGMDEADDDYPGPTFLQLLGMLEHLLGAVVIDLEEEKE